MKKEDFAKLEVKGMILLTDFSFCTFSFCAKKSLTSLRKSTRTSVEQLLPQHLAR